MDVLPWASHSFSPSLYLLSCNKGRITLFYRNLELWESLARMPTHVGYCYYCHWAVEIQWAHPCNPDHMYPVPKWPSMLSLVSQWPQIIVVMEQGGASVGRELQFGWDQTARPPAWVPDHKCSSRCRPGRVERGEVPADWRNRRIASEPSSERWVLENRRKNMGASKTSLGRYSWAQGAGIQVRCTLREEGDI